MTKKRLSRQQLKVLSSLATKGKENIQGVQLREGMNYSTANRSMKMLDRLSFVWLSYKDEEQGQKGAQEYSLTPLGVVEALLRGDVRSRVDRVVEYWGEVSPRYVHHWMEFEEVGLADRLWKCLNRLYPERVVINRIVPLDVHEAFRSYIQPSNFPGIRDGLDHVLFDMSIEGISASKEVKGPFISVISSDPEYQNVWSSWFWIEKNKFEHVRRLNTSLKRKIKLMQDNS